MTQEKIILTDADGVLVNWLDGFEKFMLERGYPRTANSEHEYEIPKRHDNVPPELVRSLLVEFSESEDIANLEACNDAVKYVKMLADEGFRFHVITALSDSPIAHANRTKNLEKLFGPIFDSIQCIKMGAIKTEYLRPWEGSGHFWIEDHASQAKVGYELGLRAVLINCPHNMHFAEDLFPRVSETTPWKEIYEMVMNGY